MTISSLRSRDQVTAYIKTVLLLLLPLFAAVCYPLPPPVETGKHKVVIFSDRGVSGLSIRALTAHGFSVSVHTNPIRPAFLDPRWEKVFVIQKALANPGQLETITWIDDDLMPDMHWFRRLVVSNKAHHSMFAGFEYGRRKHNIIMSNLLVFRVGPEAQKLVEQWADAHVRYLNKTTGVQDQDALNEETQCHTAEVDCITHSFYTTHTSGASGMRVEVLDRAARRHLWEHHRVLPRVLFVSIFVCLSMRAWEFNCRSNVFPLLCGCCEIMVANMRILGLALGMAVIFWESIPNVNDIGRVSVLGCTGRGQVRRMGESALSLSGRWLMTRGTLVYADWLNRHEMACIPRKVGALGARLVIWTIERRIQLALNFGAVIFICMGALFGCCLPAGKALLVRGWMEKRKMAE